MAVNKNFVVKNGLEVAENLIFANSDKVGIGSTAPLAKLDVRGNINATDVFSSGVTTVATAFNVGTAGTIIAGTTNGLVGFGTAVPAFIVDIKSPVSTGQTTLNVFGDAAISGDIKIDNNINLSGVSTFSGAAAFGGSATFGGDVTISGSLSLTGIATAETFSGFSNLQSTHSATTKVFNVTVAGKSSNHRYAGQGSGNAYYVDGVEAPFLTLTPGRTYRFLMSSSDMSAHPFRFYLEADRTTAYTNGVTSTATYTEITITDTTPTVLFYQCSVHAYMGNAVNTNSNVLFTSGIATATTGSFTDVSVTSGATVGLLTATNATVSGGVNVSGALTAASLVGDGSGITGFPAGSVGVSSGGTIIGTGATIIDFTAANAVITATPTSAGISTVTVTPSVSLGLVIAIGG